MRSGDWGGGKGNKKRLLLTIELGRMKIEVTVGDIGAVRGAVQNYKNETWAYNYFVYSLGVRPCF